MDMAQGKMPYFGARSGNFSRRERARIGFACHDPSLRELRRDLAAAAISGSSGSR
jgi:hypothetical protein